MIGNSDVVAAAALGRVFVAALGAALGAGGATDSASSTSSDITVAVSSSLTTFLVH